MLGILGISWPMIGPVLKIWRSQKGQELPPVLQGLDPQHLLLSTQHGQALSVACLAKLLAGSPPPCMEKASCAMRVTYHSPIRGRFYDNSRVAPSQGGTCCPPERPLKRPDYAEKKDEMFVHYHHYHHYHHWPLTDAAGHADLEARAVQSQGVYKNKQINFPP